MYSPDEKNGEEDKSWRRSLHSSNSLAQSNQPHHNYEQYSCNIDGGKKNRDIKAIEDRNSMSELKKIYRMGNRLYLIEEEDRVWMKWEGKEGAKKERIV